MLVYRLCKARFADLSGEGARLYGGRWNNPGMALVYTAGSLSLALLETRVHLKRMPADYVRLTIEIPDAVFNPLEVNLASSPDWRSDLALTRSIGDKHFTTDPSTPLKVPSILVDTEWNFLVSRDYAAAHASIVERQPVSMDPRLWAG